MKTKSKLTLESKILMGFIFIPVGLTIMIALVSAMVPDSPRTGMLVDAVVECQESIRSTLSPVRIDFDNAFKYKGTKETYEGTRFQVAGKLRSGKLEKPYGCIVNYENAEYEVEVIL